MKQLNVEIDDSLDKEYRATVGKIKGFRKGAIVEATEEAIIDWIRKAKKDSKK